MRGGRQYGGKRQGRAAKQSEERSRSPTDLDQAIEGTLGYKADSRSTHALYDGVKQAPYRVNADIWI